MRLYEEFERSSPGGCRFHHVLVLASVPSIRRRILPLKTYRSMKCTNRCFPHACQPTPNSVRAGAQDRLTAHRFPRPVYSPKRRRTLRSTLSFSGS